MSNTPLYIIRFMDPSENKAEGGVMNVYSPSVFIGRSDRSCINYNLYDSVSRTHAEIHYSNKKVFLENKNANNITLLNGKEVRLNVEVNYFDILQFSYKGPRIMVLPPEYKLKLDYAVLISSLLLFLVFLVWLVKANFS